MLDFTRMILALVLKQNEGTMIVEKATFDAMQNDYEILLQRNNEGNAILTLVEDEKQIQEIRKQRANEEARAKFKEKIIVPR